MKLSPNRVTLYLTAAVDITGALVSLLGGLDGPQVAGLTAALVTLNGLAVMFLRGWQQFESANYQADLIGMQHAAGLERQAAAVEQAKQVGRPPSGKIAFPGR